MSSWRHCSDDLFNYGVHTRIKISLISDETSDCGHHEQHLIIVRYFCKNRAKEVFFALDRLTKIDSNSVFYTLQAVLTCLYVSWHFTSSVCFD